ncbi:MAG: LPS export ABC transporter periplasmic protein LptC [Thermodesulfobacteriota bacterium]
MAAILAGAGLAAILHQPVRLPTLDSGAQAPLDADGRPRMRGLTYTHVEQGVRKWSLKANGARYEEDSGKVYLTDVNIEFYRKDGNTIKLRGDQGVYNQKTQVVTLKGHVDGRTADGNQLLTDWITYREKDKVAETDAEVTVQGAQYKVQGAGMLVLVEQNKVILKKNVRSTFTPQGKGPPPGVTKD